MIDETSAVITESIKALRNSLGTTMIRAIRMPLVTAQGLLRTKDIQRIIIHLNESAQTTVVQNQLRYLFNEDEGFDIKPWYELKEADFIIKTRAFYARIFLVLKTILIVVVILSIYNTMNMAVMERIGEIGTLMAMGTRKIDVVRLFILEGCIMGVIGGLMGMVGGYLLAVFISYVGIPMPTPPGASDELNWIARIMVVPSEFLSALILSVMTALVSSIIPSTRASRMEIAEALRHNV